MVPNSNLSTIRSWALVATHCAWIAYLSLRSTPMLTIDSLSPRPAVHLATTPIIGPASYALALVGASRSCRPSSRPFGYCRVYT